jgi:hypothetical protein
LCEETYACGGLRLSFSLMSITIDIYIVLSYLPRKL